MSFKFRKIICLLVSASFLVSLASCKAEQKTFPELSFEDDNVTSETTISTDEDEFSGEITDNIYNISMAVPYSQQTMDRLLKLYYLKAKDRMPEAATGADIDLDYLDSVSTPWIVNVINIPRDGVGTSTVLSWINNDDVPDIFLVNDFDSIVVSGYCDNIGDYLGEYDMSGASVYGSALTYCMNADGAYGVPLYQSFMIMYGNSDYIPEAGQIPFRSTYTEFGSYLEAINQEYNVEDTNVVVPLARGYELIPYITEGSYMLGSEYLVSDNWETMLQQDIDYIDGLYEQGIAMDEDADGSDPTITRCSAMWLDSTINMERWLSYYPDNVYFTMIPNESDSNELNLYSSIYPLCLSNRSTQKKFAAEFAAFICFDTDAQLLLQRVEPMTGFYPIIDSDSVWDIICSNESYGSMSLAFRQNMSNSYYCPPSGSRLEQRVTDYCSDYASYYSTDNPEQEHVFNLEEVLG